MSRDDTQAELARMLGMRAMTVSDWERGVVDCGDKALAHVAAAYGTTPDNLLVEWLSAGFTTIREKD